MPANLFAHELAGDAAGKGAGVAEDAAVEKGRNGERERGYGREVQLSVLLFWLSRLQLPGHAFGLALPWLRWAFGCLRLVVDFLAVYSLPLASRAVVVVGHKFVFVFGCCQLECPIHQLRPTPAGALSCQFPCN